MGKCKKECITHTHIHTTVLRLSRFCLSRYQKKHSPTHAYHGHQSSLIFSIYIHGILSVQFTCLTVFFHNLSPSILWSTSWPGTLHFILHTFLHPIVVFFSQHIPIPSQPVCCTTEIMSSNPSLSLNPLLGV